MSFKVVVTEFDTLRQLGLPISVWKSREIGPDFFQGSKLGLRTVGGESEVAL